VYKGFWYCYDDVPAGGNSTVKLETKTIEKALMTGKVTSRYEYSFIGMGYYLSPMSLRTSFNLRDYKGIRFIHKGDGNIFRVKIVSTHPVFINKDSDNHFGFDFKTAGTHEKQEILFSSMSQQPGWGSRADITDALTLIKEIQFMTTARPLEKVELEIEGLEIF
jgi:hypothetical protein